MNAETLRQTLIEEFPELAAVMAAREHAHGATLEDFFIHGAQTAAEEPKAFPRELLQECAKIGLTGMEIPEAYGGSAMSAAEQAAVMEELARGHAGLALSILVLNSLTAYEINKFGTDEQKTQYLPGMAAGELFGCFGLTEPDKGSDAKGIDLKAEWLPESNEYRINGAKRFITGANGADFVVLATRTGSAEDRGEGITVFVVDMKSQGITIPEPYQKAGQPGSPLCEIYFDNVMVPASNMLGKKNEGWQIIDATLKHSRNWIAAQGVGLAQRAYDEAADYAEKRKAFGKYLSEMPEHQNALQVMNTQTEIARVLTRIAAAAEDSGQENFWVLSSLSKLVACDTASYAPTEGMQLHGGIGYTSEMPISQVWLDSPVLRIYEGTAPIQIKLILKGGIHKDTVRKLIPPKLSEVYLAPPEELVHPEAVREALQQYEAHQNNQP